MTLRHDGLTERKMNAPLSDAHFHDRNNLGVRCAEER